LHLANVCSTFECARNILFGFGMLSVNIVKISLLLLEYVCNNNNNNHNNNHNNNIKSFVATGNGLLS
jgi:hypothetical protein